MMATCLYDRCSEFWRYNGRLWRIYALREGEYVEAEVSPTFAWVPKVKLYEFLAAARQSEMSAERNFWDWVRSQRQD